MANDSTVNPLIADTDDSAISTDPVHIDSILVYPTAVNWEFSLLTAAGGTLVCKAFGADKGSYQFFFPPEFKKPLYVEVLTNCTLQIYRK